MATNVCATLWAQYQAQPTSTNVLDTHQPLYTLPFPSVTVCSGTRLKKEIASHTLYKYLPSDMHSEKKDRIVANIMSALSFLQFPKYYLMKPYLQSEETKQTLDLFVRLNITDFMLKVLPTCEEVFDICYWHGRKVNCCEEFSLQRTEEGFCWSFNSLTTEITSHCTGVPEELETPECHLRHNTGYSSGSGLELYLRPDDPLENIGAQQVVNGNSIHVHTPHEFPFAGTGVFTPNSMGSYTSLALTPEVTLSNPAVKTLAVEYRKCLFPDEGRLHIQRGYTESGCLAECRLRYIVLKCHCKPYFFHYREYQVPDCGISHLPCLAKHSTKLQTVVSPQLTEGDVKDSLDCDCKPLCFSSVYDLNVHRRTPPNTTSDYKFAMVDIYYKKSGFTIYQRRIVFGFLDLIGAVGGAANLFLGFSLLSMVECVHCVLKIFVTSFQNKIPMKKTKTKVYPTIYLE